MTAHVRVSSSYEPITEIHVRVSGSWEPVVAGYVKVSGAWEQFFSTTVELTLTIGEETVYGYAYPYTGYTGFGYDNGNDYYGYAGGFGGISSATYSDAGGTTRTIEVLAEYLGGGAYAGQDFAEFVLTGSVPNTNAVFVSIYNVDTGESLARSAATYQDMGSYTVWTWDLSVAGPWSGLSGTDAIEIRFA